MNERSEKYIFQRLLFARVFFLHHSRWTERGVASVDGQRDIMMQELQKISDMYIKGLLSSII